MAALKGDKDKALRHDPARLAEVIQNAEGNISTAAKQLGVSRQHVTNLVRHWRLIDWARKIRLKNGHPPTGNPLRLRPRKLSHLSLDR